MIHYLDTSALVKRYVSEPGAGRVRALFRRGKIVTARIAYAELAATVARLGREGRLDEAERAALFDRLDADFAAMAVVEIRPGLMRRIPALVTRQPLRGCDAVHLAAALLVREQGAAVQFWSADGRLVRAAAAEGLRATHSD